MFYSGNWSGYWEQAGYGRQAMHPLTLIFHDHLITGEGRDLLGAFTFSGTYESDGMVKMVKHYLKKHSVYYTGTYDGEGTIFGQWMVAPGVVGLFALQPQRPNNTSELPIQDL